MKRNEPFRLSSSSFLEIAPWSHQYDNIVAGISTRNGGVSKPPFDSLNVGFQVKDTLEDIVLNRQILAQSLNSNIDDWITVDQIHGHHIIEVKKEDKRKDAFVSTSNVLGEADGMYTTEGGIYLAASFADCTPLFFFSPKYNLVGITHAGWKGTVAQVGPKMIRIWHEQHGVPLREIRVAVGPAIGQCCYEVDDRVMDHVRNLPYESNNKPFSEKMNGKSQLDLKQLNAQLLLHAGIREENLEVSTHCTSCQKALFFSHRRDEGNTGRMFGVIAMT
ncbi:peptidoglycan editing factor PgeF [Bacillus solimangrovi]|uniref:Purine nucleoside phosphorylase n=1 Tax=Bacillus solimangrovi TaxID=1305675 RepID=A0A1E5LAQ6_9BACI|nr:peptidoglycan editing factor PgeF [Bacillus solimangrovi]OEH91180.1 hypothetical protein BFG57_06070 [Bacillus solimangrovi]